MLKRNFFSRSIIRLGDIIGQRSLPREERQIVKRRILERDVRGVRTIIIARGDSAVENPQVQNYRDKIHTEYDGLIVKMSGARKLLLYQKIATFPWRGVVDMRGPNGQTRACGYPLPSIEETLLNQGKNFIFFGA